MQDLKVFTTRQTKKSSWERDTSLNNMTYNMLKNVIFQGLPLINNAWLSRTRIEEEEKGKNSYRKDVILKYGKTILNSIKEFKDL